MTMVVLFSIMLAALPAARAQDPAPEAAPVLNLTPDEGVRLGLANSARRRAASADSDAAAAVARQARAGRLPAVRSQAGYTRLSGNIPNVTFALPGMEPVTLQAVALDQFRAEVSAEQTLFAGSRVRNEIRAAEHGATAAERRARQEDADIALDIRRAYWELHRAIAAREALSGALERVEAHLGDVKSRVREGAALRRDLLSAQTRRSEVQLERLEADNAVRVAQLELDRLLGLPLDTIVRPVSDGTRDAPVEGTTAKEPEATERGAAAPRGAEDAPDTPTEDLTAAALAGRPELGALAEEGHALRAQLRAARGERWPQVGLVARYVEAHPNPYFFVEQDRFHWNWEVGFSARWNLWEGGRRRARESELAARLAAAEARLTEARAQVAVDVARKQLEVSRAREAVAVAAQNVSEAEESFRVVQRQFQEGAALSADVLDAEEAWRRAEARQSQAHADHWTAKAAVLGALGQVW